MSNIAIIIPSIIGSLLIIAAIIIGVWTIKKNKDKTTNKELTDNKNFYKERKIIGFNKVNDNPSGIVLSCGLKRINKITNKFVIKNLNSNTKIKKIDKTKLSFSISEQKSAVVIAPPGSGKTQALLFPTILYNVNCKQKPNLIVTDPKPEILDELYHEFNKNGYQIINLSLKEIKHGNGYVTDYWNPFDNIISLHKQLVSCNDSTKNQNLFGLLQNEISLILDPFYRDTDKKSDYWLGNAKTLISFMICFMLYKVEIKEFGYQHINFKNLVLNLMSISIDDLKEQAELVKKKVGNLEQLQQESKALFLSRLYLSWSSEKSDNLKSFTTEAQNRLNVFADNYFGLLTSQSTFDLDSLINSNKPFAFFLTINTSSTAKLSEKSLLNLYLEMLNKKISDYKATNKNFRDRPLYWLIDEAGNLDTIPFLNSIIAFGRSQKNFAIPIFQTFEQIENKYGSSLLEASEYRILFNNDNDKLATRISNLIGKKELDNDRQKAKVESSDIANIPEGHLGLWTFKRKKKDKNFYTLPIVYHYMISGIIKSSSFTKINDSYDLSKYEQIVNLVSEEKETKVKTNLFELFEIIFDKSKIGFDEFEKSRSLLNSIFNRFLSLSSFKKINKDNSTFKKVVSEYEQIKKLLLTNSSIIDSFIKYIEKTEMNIYYQDSRFSKEQKC